MKLDWDRTVVSMRRAWNFKDASSLHSTCEVFLYLLNTLERKIPREEFEGCKDELWKNFRLGLYDPEIEHLVEHYTPPIDLTVVSFLRTGTDSDQQAFVEFNVNSMKES